MVVWFNGRTVRNTNELTNRNANPSEKHGEIWTKTVNIGDLFMEHDEAIKDTISQFDISEMHARVGIK